MESWNQPNLDCWNMLEDVETLKCWNCGGLKAVFSKFQQYAFQIARSASVEGHQASSVGG